MKGEMNMNIEQSYHLEPKKGLLNDPVGLIWFNQRYHVFFQWNSKRKDHSSKEWAHMSSQDLIHWIHHESPLIPSESYDRNGVYSGSSCINEGQLFSYYTGNRKENNLRTVKQCLAVSRDGIHFEKKGPILDVPEGYTQHFRDPRVIRLHDQYVMLIGAQNLNRAGCLLLFKSKDGIDWSFSHIVGTTTAYNMVECPDLVCLEGKQVLIYCPQGRDPITDDCLESFSVYRILEQDIMETRNLNLDTDWIRLESGFDGYAPQTLVTPDRHLIFTWMNRLDEQQEKQLSEMAEHVHCLTLPRELHIQGDRIIQKPAAEMYSLFAEDGIPVSQSCCLAGREWLMRIKEIQNSFSLHINEKEVVLHWNANTRILIFERSWPFHKTEVREIHLSNLNLLELFMDTSSLEIFVNNGEHVISARILPQQSGTRMLLDVNSCTASVHTKIDNSPFIV